MVAELLNDIPGNDGTDKSKLPYVGNTIKYGAADLNGPVIDIRGRRGVNLNIPALSTTSLISIYTSPTIIALGQGGSLMTRLNAQTFIPSSGGRTNFDSVAIATSFFMQFILNLAEGSEFNLNYTLS